MGDYPILVFNVNRLVSDGKNVFGKSPMRIDLFRNKCPNFPLPPTLIATQRGTWLSAVLYYVHNSDSVKSVVDELDKDDIHQQRSF